MKRRSDHSGKPAALLKADQADAGRARWRTWLFAIILIAAGCAAYANSFQGVFLYDDIHHIVEDERIRTLWPPSHWWPHRRPVVVATLALNYALGGLNPWGYHLVNLVIHLLAGLTLYGLLRRTLGLTAALSGAGPQTMPHRESPDRCLNNSGIALSVALLWLVHPLQTQSVTYVIQRGESLMGLFFLLTIYSLVRGATAPRRAGLWYAIAIVACALGMGSKAVMVVAPVVALSYDRTFLAGSFRNTLQRRWPLYLVLAATWGVLVATDVVRGTIAPRDPEAVMGFGFRGATPWQYLLTQAEVIPHYLRLVVWPHPLCLDYGWPFAKHITEVALPGMLVLALLTATLWALVRRPSLGFLGAWFFLILAPTSSIIPIQDAAYEHRMYLPLAAVITLVVISVYGFLRRIAPHSNRCRIAVAAVLLTGTTAALAGKTIQRNKVYASDLAMWQDVVNTRPENARAHYNLGNALRERGDLDAARAAYERAIQLSPEMAIAHNNLGNLLRLMGQPEAAIRHLRRAVTLDPDFAAAYVNLAAALAGVKRHEEAVEAGRRACTLDPQSAEAHYNLAMSLGALGRFEEAAEALRKAVHLMERTGQDAVTLGRTYYYLGVTLARIERRDEAIAALQRAIAWNPGDDRARDALANLSR